MAPDPTISVVIPVYNSELSLPQLVERLDAVLGARAAGFEIILVDDGSADGSWKVIKGLAVQIPLRARHSADAQLRAA